MNYGHTTGKYKIIEWITSLKDVAILKRLKSLKEESQNEDWWDTLSAAEKEGIQKGLQDIEESNLIPHNVGMKELKKQMVFESKL